MKTKTKALIVGGAAAAVLAGGGVAVAATATPSPTTGQGTPAASAGTGKGHHGRDGLAIGRIEHGQFVTKDEAGDQVTHDVVGGDVTAVSATSISVEDGTGATTTFVVGTGTRVHVKGQAKGTRNTIADIKTGQTVTVVGTGTGPFTATRVSAH